MGTVAQYKKYKRGIRQANVETDFSSGMMYSDGTIPEGYVKTLVNFDFTSDGKNALKPRAGYRTKEFILPDMSTLSSDDTFLSDDVALKYSKECVEDGNAQRQFIFGRLIDSENNEGEIWVSTSPKSAAVAEGIDYSFSVAKSLRCSASHSCKFYSENLIEIHDVPLRDDAKTSFPVGAFLKNSFYFFDTDGGLCRTKFTESSSDPQEQYFFEDLQPLSRTASEVVQYGYNMLADEPYVFSDSSGGSSTFQMNGILPYDSQFGSGTDPQLLMTPKANTKVWFRCNYDIPTGKTYKIVWSWKELTSDVWTEFSVNDSFSVTEPLTYLQAELLVPDKEIMVRCEAYNSEQADVVEKAMTVGFDFTVDERGTTLNVSPIKYDLSTASGMTSWKNRLILWGVRKDPTILWISDLDEPTYFPYPNNITVFDEPIITVIEFMDSLVVFTNSKVYQVKVADDGVSWSSEVIQSNLFINPWDKHLIQAIRNMIYFKSGNYYYMIVPKAQSTTGELTLAPITTPITDFFNNFASNVSDVFNRCYRNSDGQITDPTHDFEGNSNLVTYYNFLDYEFIHNLYVYSINHDNQVLYVHFDVTYNTVDRYWKLCVYEAPHLFFPFRNDATQRGLIASTSVINTSSGRARVVQIFEVDSNNIVDLYLPSGLDYELVYDPSRPSIVAPITEALELPGNPYFTVTDESMDCSSGFIRTSSLLSGVFEVFNSSEYLPGFDIVNLADAFNAAVSYLKEHTIFNNRQFLDTGFRDSSLFVNKRYRELQLHINNVDDSDMEFGMDFSIAGEPRELCFNYEVSQVIDEVNQDAAIVYLDATPYMPIEAISIDKSNLWTIYNSLTPNIDLYKVRASISGKGSAPRVRLYTRNEFNYQLLGINWVYREMNMR